MGADDPASPGLTGVARHAVEASLRKRSSLDDLLFPVWVSSGHASRCNAALPICLTLRCCSPHDSLPR